LVVGGGATGTGIARDLALRGVDVMLVERNGLSSGASSRSHGLLHSGARYAEANRVGAEECIAENRILRSIAGACIRDTGGLFVQLAGDDAAYFDEKRAACEAIGIETRLLSRAEVRVQVPDLSAEVERAMWMPDGVVYPSRLCAANAADAEAHGATVHPHSPLENMVVEDAQVAKAMIGGDVDATIEPEYLVNAAGAWAGTVASMAGLTVEMAPSRGVMISVEHGGLGPALNRCRNPDDGDIIVPHADEVVLGTTSVPVSDPDDYERADWEIETSVRECAAMLPPVADAPVGAPGGACGRCTPPTKRRPTDAASHGASQRSTTPPTGSTTLSASLGGNSRPTARWPKRCPISSAIGSALTPRARRPPAPCPAPTILNDSTTSWRPTTRRARRTRTYRGTMEEWREEGWSSGSGRREEASSERPGGPPPRRRCGGRFAAR
jgi:glycerol-3-phosphate dehydrogenase